MHGIKVMESWKDRYNVYGQRQTRAYVCTAVCVRKYRLGGNLRKKALTDAISLKFSVNAKLMDRARGYSLENELRVLCILNTPFYAPLAGPSDPHIRFFFSSSIPILTRSHEFLEF